MTLTPAPQAPRRRMLGTFVARPRLLVAAAAGLAVWTVCLLLPSGLSTVTTAILAWDATCLTFIALAFHMMWGADRARMRAVM